MLPDVYHAVHTCAKILIGGNDIGNLNAGDIEALGRGYERNAVLRKLLRNRSERHVSAPGGHDFAVNLVAYHLYSVLHANISQPHQFLAAPKPSAGVVGVAEKEGLGGRIRAAALDVIEIYVVAARIRIPYQPAFGSLASLIGDVVEETIVCRHHQYHLVAGLGEGLHGNGCGGHDTLNGNYLLAGDVPSVPAAEPADDSLVVAVRHKGISENALRYAFLQGFDDEGGGGEIHLRNPHRNHAFGAGIPLDGSGATRSTFGSEVVFHSAKSFFIHRLPLMRRKKMIPRTLSSMHMAIQ